MPILCILEGHKLKWGSTGWVHFPVDCTTESFLFDVLEYGDESCLESGSGVLADGVKCWCL